MAIINMQHDSDIIVYASNIAWCELNNTCIYKLNKGLQVNTINIC